MSSLASRWYDIVWRIHFLNLVSAVRRAKLTYAPYPRGTAWTFVTTQLRRASIFYSGDSFQQFFSLCHTPDGVPAGIALLEGSSSVYDSLAHWEVAVLTCLENSRPHRVSHDLQLHIADSRDRITAILARLRPARVVRIASFLGQEQWNLYVSRPWPEAELARLST